MNIPALTNIWNIYPIEISGLLQRIDIVLEQLGIVLVDSAVVLFSFAERSAEVEMHV